MTKREYIYIYIYVHEATSLLDTIKYKRNAAGATWWAKLYTMRCTRDRVQKFAMINRGEFGEGAGCALTSLRTNLVCFALLLSARNTSTNTRESLSRELLSRPVDKTFWMYHSFLGNGSIQRSTYEKVHGNGRNKKNTLAFIWTKEKG